MADIKILTEAELRSQISLDLEAVECVEQAFHALATKAVVMPPIMRLDILDNNGEIDVKTAYIPGLDSLAIKISPGFFDNPSLGLPSANGLMVLFSTKDRHGRGPVTGQWLFDLQTILFNSDLYTAARNAPPSIYQ